MNPAPSNPDQGRFAVRNRTALPAGPLRMATLIVADSQPMISAYGALGLQVLQQGRIDDAYAATLNQPSLAGKAVVLLGSTDPGSLQLRLIVDRAAAPRPSRFSAGWMALEILVRDVDALAAPVAAAGFEIVGPPADLDVSPNIRAMQAIGPAGEMLYLTQVRAPVPPFDIPLSSSLASGGSPGSDIGPLFIAVMRTPSRTATLAACAVLQPLQTLQFDTRITVLNRALGRDAQQRWPVATVQLGGQSLFEIDEVADDPGGLPLIAGALPQGLAWIGIESDFDHDGDSDGDAAGSLIELSRGAWIERLPRS